MITFSGLKYLTDRLSITTAGSAVTSSAKAKVFLIKITGGQCYFKRDSSIADADAYIIDDGDWIS